MPTDFTIISQLLDISASVAVASVMLWYFAGRNKEKDLQIKEIQSQVIELIKENKAEMREMLRANQNDLVSVIKDIQAVVINNTIAFQEMKSAVEKNVK